MKHILIGMSAMVVGGLQPMPFQSSNLAHAATPVSQKRLESSMKRIQQSLAQIEKQIERIKPSTSENTLNNIQKKIDRSRKLLSDVPDSMDGYRNADQSLESLQGLLTKEQDRAKQAADARASNLEKMKVQKNAESGDEHYKFMVGADNLSSAMAFMDYKHSHMDREDSITQEYVHYARQYPPTFDRIVEMLQFFDGMDPRDVREVFYPSTSQLVSSNGEAFKLANSKLEAFGSTALDVAAEKITQAASIARTAIDNGNPADLLNDQTVTGALNYLTNAAMIYRARPDASPKVLKQYKALESRSDKEIHATMRKAFTIIVKNNPPVSNKFHGLDRDQVEQMVRKRWNEAYPGDEILQVRISQSDWVQRREPGWRDGYLIMFHYSIVTPYVVVKEKDGLASEWGMVAEKDHTLNDKISISFGRLRDEKLDPRYTVLQSNLD